jgi:CHAT domain-containing protein
VELVDLGDVEKETQKALHDIRVSVDSPDGDTAAQSIKSLGSLYADVWTPLEKSLAGVDKVLLSPDGLLNLVPFAALQDQAGKVLLERYVLGYVNSGRDLLGVGEQRATAQSELLLVANPACDGKVSRAGGRVAQLVRGSSTGSLARCLAPNRKRRRFRPWCGEIVARKSC